MFVLPDLTEQYEAIGREGILRENAQAAQFQRPVAMTTGLMLLMAALFLAGAGLWSQPTAGYAVLVIKLGASLVMLAAGAVLMSVLRARREVACVQVDTRRQEIRTYEQDMSGEVFLTGRYDLRDMTEVSLHNRTLFARDAGGRLVVSVPVRGRRQERALREILKLS